MSKFDIAVTIAAIVFAVLRLFFWLTDNTEKVVLLAPAFWISFILSMASWTANAVYNWYINQ